MKNKSQLKKSSFLPGSQQFIHIKLVCTDSYIKNRWNIKAGYARYKKDFRQEKVGNYRIGSKLWHFKPYRNRRLYWIF